MVKLALNKAVSNTAESKFGSFYLPLCRTYCFLGDYNPIQRLPLSELIDTKKESLFYIFSQNSVRFTRPGAAQYISSSCSVSLDGLSSSFQTVRHCTLTVSENPRLLMRVRIRSWVSAIKTDFHLRVINSQME